MMNQIRFRNGKIYTPSKIICIGLNYAAHIDEMNSKRSGTPVIFTKPNSALHPIETPIPIPLDAGAVHHEVELAVCIGRKTSHISGTEVFNHIAGYALALDLTLRDMQKSAKDKGHPWAIAKGFDHSCPISAFVEKDTIDDVNNLDIRLALNGEMRQHGNTSQMIFKLPQLIAYISRFFTLEEGDLILTGTPAGVGALHPNDHIRASIDNIADIETTII
jgi:2-keto-4-pentenoate hydratase/2-oxohepta-3-ene-1,7-dioic acid hydratase in catechol pathway